MTTLSSHPFHSLKAFLRDAVLWRTVGAWAFVAVVCVILANAIVT